MADLFQIGRSSQSRAPESPEWVRISYASALALRFKSGQFMRDFEFGGINLLLSYARGCQSDCGYCGLARSRMGAYEDKSFIRVEWPLVETDELIDRLARFEDRLTRLCISMVTHGHSYRDTLDITTRIRGRVQTPLSLLVAPPSLNEERLRSLHQAGAGMIGIGLDAATENLFRSIRTNVPQGALKWDQYWEIVGLARDIYGPWQVNCHTLVGLGETDRDLMELFDDLLNRQIFAYLFCFNPEPDSAMAGHPRTPIRRWRRIQLAKFLLEECGLDPAAFSYDSQGALTCMEAPEDLVHRAIRDGYAFMTNGCPSVGGEPGCTRPMGSWCPADEPRDYPWMPSEEDRRAIYSQLDLQEILRPGPGPMRPRDQCAPPVAGRMPLSESSLVG